MASSFAKKSLGQHFLCDGMVRERILDSAGDIKDRAVLEVGPGTGFLTSHLLRRGARVTAVEADSRLIPRLQLEFGHNTNFRLIEGDILQVDLDALFPDTPYEVIANIPYNITAPLIRKFLTRHTNRPTRCILMVQKEVAEKICDSKKRSLLSLSVEVYAQPEYLFTVTRDMFAPPPKVDSAILQIVLRDEPLVAKELEQDFFTVVSAGFSQKRKKLGNVLGGHFGIPSQQLLGDIDPNLRPEKLRVEEWTAIARNLKHR